MAFNSASSEFEQNIKLCYCIFTGESQNEVEHPNNQAIAIVVM